MTVSLEQWRAMIGTFNCGSFIHHQQSGKKLYMLFTYLYSTQMPLYFSINPSVYLLIFAM